MKLIILALLTGTICLGSLSAQSQPPIYQLEVGPTSPASNQVADIMYNHSGAIGWDNDVSLGASLAVGAINILGPEGTGGYNAAIGLGNTMTHYASLAVGSLNTNTYSNSALIGAENVNHGANNLIGGMMNSVLDSAWSAFVAGRNNVVEGPTDSASVLGRGNINKWSNATIVGSYNDSTVVEPLRFAVGVGTGNPADGERERANALEVYANGTIIMAVQGDISMGEFGVSNP